jgi:hypothetical protein
MTAVITSPPTRVSLGTPFTIHVLVTIPSDDEFQSATVAAYPYEFDVESPASIAPGALPGTTVATFELTLKDHASVQRAPHALIVADTKSKKGATSRTSALVLVQ